MNIADLIRTTATRYGLDPALALAVAQQESGLNPAAVSPAGAIGLMQLMPATAADLGVDPLDPAQNAAAGIQYLRDLMARYGDLTLALQAYNWGPGNMDAYLRTGYGAHGQPMPAETQQYAASVLARLSAISASPIPTVSNPPSTTPGAGTDTGGGGGGSGGGDYLSIPQPAITFLASDTMPWIAVAAGAGILALWWWTK